MVNVIVALAVASLPSPDQEARTAVIKGLKRIEASATNYVKNRNCFSCHHQAVTVQALASARERGFAIDEEVFKKQVRYTVDFYRPKVKDILKGTGIGGASTTAAYALFMLEAAKHQRDEITDALLEFLLKKQDKDGGWTATTVRPPTEGSKLTIVALALQNFERYRPPAEDDEAELATRVEQARERAAAFLMRAKPANHEDRVFRLRGLVLAGAGGKEIHAATDDLLKRQRIDGGWAQLDGAKSDELPEASPVANFFTSRTARARFSDAYATATVLVALRMAGVSAKDPAYRKGVQFLLKSQDESGGWIVTSRSKPIQLLFDNGDPGGMRSGFISNHATGWAVLALLEYCEKK